MSNISDLGELIGNLPEATWLEGAACGELDLERLELFFVDAGRTLSREARQLCGNCPVPVECLRHAYDHDIVGGYFGGMSPSKRRSLPLERAVELISG
jgi:WhiB family redox-sensing transcriptional regulator